MPLKSECLSFNQIPHTTRLFADFLSYTDSVRQFYPRSPQFSEWFRQENPNQRYDPARRARTTALLERQNKSFGSSAKTMANIARLRAGACAAVTGQQVGLFGGPAFSLYKALTAVKLAEEATAGGVDCVPVFWLATEDHDFAEVNHTRIPNSECVLETFSIAATGPEDAPVGSVSLGPGMDAVSAAAAAVLGAGDTSDALLASYKAEETMGSSFARLFAKLFADWGVILLDAGDPEVDSIVTPIYRAAVEHSEELNAALLERGEALESAGYQPQVKVTPSSMLLFQFRNGARVPIHRRAEVSGGPEEFSVGDAHYSKVELLEKVSSAPREFSANVLLRPVLQDFLLPTLVYTGGSAEVAYFAQVAVVYEKLLGHVTPILPRFSATLVEPKPGRLLERYGLALNDLFRGPENLQVTLAQRALPTDLQAAFDQANEGLETALGGIRDLLAKLDATLVDAAKNAAEKMRHQLEQLRARAARAELRQSELLTRHGETLNNLLYPEKALQEREIAGVYFLARYGASLLHDLYAAIRTDCLNHQVIQL